MIIYLLILCLVLVAPLGTDSRALEVGDQLTQLIKDHPDKTWLIKFYAPWCHHCQQMEILYNQVSETLHREFEDILVGRVDCSRYEDTCRQYNVQYFPTVVYIDKKGFKTFKLERTHKALTSFARRMHTPDILKANNCKHLISLADQEGLIIVSTAPNIAKRDLFNEVFSSLAYHLKESHWFYHFPGKCNNLIRPSGLYLIKRGLKKPISFTFDPNLSMDEIVASLLKSIQEHSHPIFAMMDSNTFDKIVKTKRTTLVALLDEYKPARRFSPSSTEFYKVVEKIAKDYAQNNDSLRFVWTSNVLLMQSVVMHDLPVPNFILLEGNMNSYVLLKSGELNNSTESAPNQLPTQLSESRVRKAVEEYRKGLLKLSPGSGLHHAIYREVYKIFMNMWHMYNVNPIQAFIFIGFPSILLLVVLFINCSGYPSSSFVPGYNDNTEELPKDSTSPQGQNNHAHQD